MYSTISLLNAVFVTTAVCLPLHLVCADPLPRNEVVESVDVLRGSKVLPPIDPGFDISVTSFGGSVATDGQFLSTGSPSSEFVGVDDPLEQPIGSGVITVELNSQQRDPEYISISAIELEAELPFDPNICNQVWQLGRDVDVDDLGIQEDGARACRVATTWLRFASSFCTQRRQAGVFLVEFRPGDAPTWTLLSVLDSPEPETDFGASVALEGDTLIIGAPGGNGPFAGGRAHLYTQTNGTYALEETLAPFQPSELSLGDCVWEMEDHFLIYGRNDRFGNDIDISEDGALAIIGAPGTIDEQTSQPRYVDGAGAIYVVRLDTTDYDIRFIPNPDSGALSACSTPGSGCTPSQDHAQADLFGTSVSITYIAEQEIHRFAGTAPGDFGMALSESESGKLCESDQGIDQGPCHLQTGSVAIYDFTDFADWPASGPEWIPDIRYHWKPGAERAQQNRWGFAYAFVGGHADTTTTPGFMTGGSLDLEGNEVLVGGPNGFIIDPSGTIDIPPCESWLLPLASRRGTALILSVPSNPTETVGAFRELVPAEEPYPPSWRFGEAVALFNGEAAVSLSWPNTTECDQGSNIDCDGMGSIYTFELIDGPIIPGDLDGDGEVNGSDLGLFLAVWGSQGPLGDLNGDGWVNGNDLGLMLVNWTS